MRSIRNAAVAGVTALAVSLSGVTAFAAENPKGETTNTSSAKTTEGEKTEKSGNLSYDLGTDLQADKAVRGDDALGSTTLPKDKLPKWFNLWEGFTIAGIVLTILTNLIAPAYNYLKFNGII